ncbi:nonstructural protein [Rice dwarf virus]|uniref:nonstructural protein n=1 Tax=Rice dwarf virus TaxID=10991 RepID=UPI0000163926|nr:nonstructural protein [Rice dwarf virus]AAA88766.1 nonstructural protein [Rice dwarf virus]
MEVDTATFVRLHHELLCAHEGPSIISKFDAIKKVKLGTLANQSGGANNITEAFFDKLRNFERKSEAYLASDLAERELTRDTHKAIVFVTKSVLLGGKSLKDLLPYGVIVCAFIFIPETASVLDNVRVMIGNQKRPLTVALIKYMAKSLNCDLVGDSYDIFYYCNSSAYGKNLISVSENDFSNPQRALLSVGDLCYQAARSIHVAAANYIRIFDRMPPGFQPSKHLFRIIGVLDMETLKTMVTSNIAREPGMFSHDNVKDVLHRTGVFSPNHHFSAVILWRGWASTYAYMFNQEQLNMLSGTSGLAGDFGKYKLTYGSTFHEGVIHVQYQFVTPEVVRKRNIYPDLSALKGGSS